MKINAVGVASSNIKKSVEFYSLLGFEFGEIKDDEDHIEPKTPDGSARLMIDSTKLIKKIIGEDPKPSNTSNFAIEYDSVDELNNAAQKVKDAGYEVVKEPWDAFWGQRYCIVSDPDGNKVDLYCNL